MNVLVRVGLVMTVLFAGIVLPGSAAQACTCAMPSTYPPQKQYLKSADAAFTGEIVDKRDTTPVRVGPYGRAAKTYTIDVDTVYKGEVYAEQTLFASGGPGSMCGRSFPASGTVLIFGTEVREKPGDKSTSANQSPVRYSTHLCSGSELLEPTQQPDLGEGFAPIGAEQAAATDLTLDSADSVDWLLPAAIVGVAAALLGGLAIAIVRRRPR